MPDDSIQYQLKCRIDKARFLLEFTDNPIQDIALECGFFDCSHFSKVFKNEVGDIPTKYRDKCRKSSTTDDHSYQWNASFETIIQIFAIIIQLLFQNCCYSELGSSVQ